MWCWLLMVQCLSWMSVPLTCVSGGCGPHGYGCRQVMWCVVLVADGAVFIMDVRSTDLCVRWMWSAGDRVHLSTSTVSLSQSVFVLSTVPALWMVRTGWTQRTRSLHGGRIHWTSPDCWTVYGQLRGQPCHERHHVR